MASVTPVERTSFPLDISHLHALPAPQSEAEDDMEELSGGGSSSVRRFFASESEQKTALVSKEEDLANEIDEMEQLARGVSSLTAKSCCFAQTQRKGPLSEEDTKLEHLYKKDMLEREAKLSFESVSAAALSSTSLGAAPTIGVNGWNFIRVNVAGKVLEFKDVFIFLAADVSKTQTILKWDWKWDGCSSTLGMHHSPGYRREDIDYYIFAHKTLPVPEVVILSTGRRQPDLPDNDPISGMLKVSSEIKKYLLSKGVKEVVVCNTPFAIRKYRELGNGSKSVAAFFHTTC